MLLSRHQNAGQNHDIKIANRSFENVAQFKYLGMTVANQNSIKVGKRPEREAYHSPTASAKVKKMCIYTSTPPYAFMV
jgi:hypothetical protein